MWVKDGPVLNLNLKGAGDIGSAKPMVTPTLGAPGLPEPAPVILPADQDKPAA
jgi:hypothetical protein